MSTFRWGILGPGRIAHDFADAFAALPDAALAAVASRDKGRAQAFAARYGMGQAYGDYAQLLADPGIDAVYIATPHHAHADLARRCLEAGKPVLCEKPLTVNAAQAEALVARARERGVFLMEAMWTRLQPAWQQVRRWLREGAVGAVREVVSRFGHVPPTDPNQRWLDPAQAGGVLLDMGIYDLSLTQWVLETEPERFDVDARLAATGVDTHVAGTLHYANGAQARFACSFETELANDFHVTGTTGSLHVDAPFWCPPRITLKQGDQTQVMETPHEANGYEHEIREAMRCIRQGAVGSPSIPHADTLATLRLMDAMRLRNGIRYPFE